MPFLWSWYFPVFLFSMITISSFFIMTRVQQIDLSQHKQKFISNFSSKHPLVHMYVIIIKACIKYTAYKPASLASGRVCLSYATFRVFRESSWTRESFVWGLSRWIISIIYVSTRSVCQWEWLIDWSD